MNNNQEILLKVDEIINYIKNSQVYIDYKEISLKIKNNQEIMNIFNKIKQYQKEIIHNPFCQDENDQKIKLCLETLKEYPQYIQYINLQDELNNMIIILENKINKYFHDVFN